MEYWQRKQQERKEQEDRRNYLRKRFEHYWQQASMGITDLATALSELRAEITSPDHFDVYPTDDDECPTQPFLPFDEDSVE